MRNRPHLKWVLLLSIFLLNLIWHLLFHPVEEVLEPRMNFNMSLRPINPSIVILPLVTIITLYVYEVLCLLIVILSISLNHLSVFGK